jgi:hypothetical protein
MVVAHVVALRMNFMTSSIPSSEKLLPKQEERYLINHQIMREHLWITLRVSS